MTNDSQGSSQVASIGLAVRVCAPTLLHAMRGSLHDASMLAALMEPSDAAPADPASAAEKTARRVRSIREQLTMLERQIALLGSMMTWPRAQADSVCATASALPEVVRLLRDETARRRIKLDADIVALPSHVHVDEVALQLALFTCGAWVAQQLSEHATLRFSGRQEALEAVFAFDPPPNAVISSRDHEHPLLAALVAAAGGRLSAAPHVRLSFRCASHAGASSP